MASRSWRDRHQLFYELDNLQNSNGLVVYDADTLPGSSGSPLIQKGKVVGMLLGYTNEKNLNAGISINNVNETRLIDLDNEGWLNAISIAIDLISSDTIGLDPGEKERREQRERKKEKAKRRKNRPYCLRTLQIEFLVYLKDRKFNLSNFIQ